MKKILLLFAAILLMILPVCAEYYTLEGPHFYVHFPKGYGNLASKLMVQSEDIMTRLMDEMDLEINGKSHFVIEDRVDLPNGYATNAFYPLISFFPVFPEDALLGGLGPNIDDWFETLLWHEGTHLYHIEMTDKTNYYLTRIFGRYPVFYPIWTSPMANIEGFAVYNETRYQRVGRGSDKIYPMILDAAIDADNLPNPRLTLGHYDLDRYDLAGLPYLYGWNFLEFLADNYGEYAPLTLQDIYVNKPGRLFVPKYDVALRELTGKSYNVLIQEWYDWLKQNYDAPALNPEGRIYDNSGTTIFPGFFDENEFYYAQTGTSSGIYRIDLETGKETLVKYIPNIYGNITKDISGGILYTVLDTDPTGNAYFNIYRYLNGKSKLLVKGERAYAPVATENGIYYLSHKHSQGNALYKTDMSGNTTLLYLSKPGEEILQFTVSKTDDIYVSVWQEGGFVDLGLLKDNEITLFTSDHYSDTYPVLSSDQTKLYFQSDRSGRYGIWALDLETMQVAPLVTNHYGAFKPVTNPLVQNQIAFVTYTDKGLKLGVHQVSDTTWMDLTKENPPIRETFPTLGEILKEDHYTLKQYSGAEYLQPTFWLPSIVGATVIGSDPLQNYLYSIGYNFNPFTELDSPQHDLYASFDYLINPLHSLSFALESDLKSFAFNTGYSGTIPLGKNSVNLNTSANTNGVLSFGANLNLPWGLKKITGTNQIFGRASVDFGRQSSYEYNFGFGHRLKANRNLDLQFTASYNRHRYGYLLMDDYFLGHKVLFLEASFNWVFARPMWSIGASSTMWSEKMTISPKATLLVGDKFGEYGVGFSLTNTTTLSYGSAPIDLGVQFMYYPWVDKILVSPIINF